MAGVAGVLATAVAILRGRIPAPLPPPVKSTARWDAERALRWQEETGWLVGCNFVPSTAGNQLEMWQADTFDNASIQRELAWAAGLGFNAMRVFLHDLLYQADSSAFLDRVDEYLSIADRNGIRTMLVLFDGVWDPCPRLGPQRAPRPGVHNSTWVQSPGAAVLADRRRWEALHPYVEAVIGRFASDRRVVAWDLFNEPDNPNAISYPLQEIAFKRRHVTDLVDLVFDWAEAVDPSQPLTAGVFLGIGAATERVSRINRIMLSRSDVISFHCYGGRHTLGAAIDHLSRYDRPVLCTEWLGRPRSPVDLLEVLADRRVGAFSWGLVEGKSQTTHPWTSWLRPAQLNPTRADRVWFHDLLHADGTPYSEEEAALIRRLGNKAGARG